MQIEVGPSEDYEKVKFGVFYNGKRRFDFKFHIIPSTIRLLASHFTTLHQRMASRQRGLLCIYLLLLAGASSSYEEAIGSSILLSGGGEREDDEPFEYPRHGLSCPSSDHSLYNFPVIGIVSHPGDGTSGRMSNASRDSNIPASYVKFVESAGARVIPLIYNEPEETLLEVGNSSFILFPILLSN